MYIDSVFPYSYFFEFLSKFFNFALSQIIDNYNIPVIYVTVTDIYSLIYLFSGNISMFQ